jgi:hypothetical protein
MGKDDKNEAVTLTRADLDAMIKGAVEAGVRAARGVMGVDNPEATQEERTHAQLGTPVPKRECVKTLHYKCRNPRNGAEFIAVVVPSNKWEQGRVVNLIDYRYPPDLAKRSGKTVHPQGKYGGIRVDAVYPFSGEAGGGLQGPFLPEFAQWVYDNYHKADINAFVGQSAELLPSTGDPMEWKPQATARTVGDAQLG